MNRHTFPWYKSCKISVLHKILYSYVIRMSLVCTRMSFACHSSAVLPYLLHVAKFFSYEIKNHCLQGYRVMVKPQKSDIRMTYEYIRVTYQWHTGTYEWHTNSIRLHTSNIGMTYDYIRVTYVWHTSTYEWHSSIYEWHATDMQNKIKLCIAFEAFRSKFSISFVVRTLLYVVANDFGY